MPLQTGHLRRCIRILESAYRGLHGAGFADATLKLLPQFIVDANALADAIEKPEPGDDA